MNSDGLRFLANKVSSTRLVTYQLFFILVSLIILPCSRALDIPALKMLNLPILFFPGFVTLGLVMSRRRNLIASRPLVYLLSVAISVGLLSTLHFFASSYLGNSESVSQVSFWAVLSLSLVASLFVSKEWVKEGASLMDMAVVLALPILILIISWLIYPFFQGDDTYQYNLTLEYSIRSREIIQAYLERRPNFTPMMILFHDVFGLSAGHLLRYFLPLLTATQLAIIPAFLSKGKLASWPLLLAGSVFIGSPYLLFQIGYSAPQILIILFTPAILITSYLALKEDSLALLLLSLIMSAVTLLFHELGVVLIISALVACLVWLVLKARENFRRTCIWVVSAIAVLLPYAVLLNIVDQISRSKYIIASLMDSFSPTWKWWFVSRYENPDGIVFSYPGVMGLVWYAYLGVLVALLFVVVWLYLGRRFSLKNRRYALIPLGVYTATYFITAEIYPRISLVAFLPERAWPFLVISLALALAIILKEREGDLSMKTKTIIGYLAMGIIVIGLVGYIATVQNRGILLSRHESRVVKYLRENVSEDALIVSNQSHSEGVAYYAGKRFLNVDVDNPASLEQEIDAALKQKDVKQLSGTREVNYYNWQGKLLSSDISPTSYANSDGTDVIRYYDQDHLPQVYFYFSLYRYQNTGFVGSPKYLETNKYSVRDIFYNSLKERSLIQDEGIILIRVK